jgi:predicted transcriptional regulator
MKTIKQIADEIGVSKQAVYKRTKGRLKEQLLPYAHTVDGIVYIEEQGETLIKSDFETKTAYKGAHTEPHTEAHTETPLDTVINILKSNNDTLKNELDIKNRQIDELNTRLAEAMSIINNEQLLHGGTIQQQLTESTNEDNPANNKSDKSQTKRGLWGIFRRK